MLILPAFYRASDRVAANIIYCVKPYLIEKSLQASYILKLRRNKESKISRKRGSPAKRLLKSSVLIEREKLWQVCKDCHK